MIFLLLFLSLICTAQSIDPLGYAEGYIEQQLDPLNENSQENFYQKYWHWKLPSTEEVKEHDTILLYLGGQAGLKHGLYSTEGDVAYMAQMADDFAAELYSLEHRFYGKSEPLTSDTTRSAALRHLTVENAIEDVRKFILVMNSLNKYRKPKWIVVGSSYSGLLAVLFRAAHPHLCSAVLASSAPIHPQIDFHGFDDFISHSYMEESECCYKEMKRLSYHISLGETTSHRTVNKNALQVLSFQRAVYHAVQFKSPSFNVTHACEIISHTQLTPLTRARNLKKKAAQDFSGKSASKDLLLAHWQACSELGMFQSRKNESVIGSPLFLEDEDEACKNMYNIDPTHTIARTEAYIEDKWNSATNVVLTYGTSDPNRQLGHFRSDFEKNIFVVQIAGASQSNDLRTATREDPEELVEGRRIIFHRLLALIQEGERMRSGLDEEEDDDNLCVPCTMFTLVALTLGFVLY